MEEAKVEKSPYFSKQSFLGGLINRAKALRFPWSKNGKSYSNRLKNLQGKRKNKSETKSIYSGVKRLPGKFINSIRALGHAAFTSRSEKSAKKSFVQRFKNKYSNLQSEREIVSTGIIEIAFILLKKILSGEIELTPEGISKGLRDIPLEKRQSVQNKFKQLPRTEVTKITNTLEEASKKAEEGDKGSAVKEIIEVTGADKLPGAENIPAVVNATRQKQKGGGVVSVLKQIFVGTLKFIWLLTRISLFIACCLSSGGDLLGFALCNTVCTFFLDPFRQYEDYRRVV